MSKGYVSMNGIELQDREFFAAIREGRAQRQRGAGAALLPGVAQSGAAAQRRLDFQAENGPGAARGLRAAISFQLPCVHWGLKNSPTGFTRQLHRLPSRDGTGA